MKKNMIGLLFGFIAGLVFALVAWLPDALQLAGSHAVLPWLKFGIGTTAAILLFSLAGWIAIQKHTLIITILCFEIASFLTALLAGHLPFEITKQVMQMTDATFTSLVNLPFHEGALTRTVLTIVISSVPTLIAALFFESLTSQTYLAASRMRVILPVIIFIVFFIFNAFITDDMNNRSLRAPIIHMSALIQQAQKIQSGETIPSSMKDEWVDTILLMDINVRVPYRLLVEKYDTIFSQLELLVQFGQNWYRCNMWEDQPFYCAPVII